MAKYGIYAVRGEDAIPELVDSNDVEQWARQDMRTFYRYNPSVTFVLFDEETCDEVIRYNAVHP